MLSVPDIARLGSLCILSHPDRCPGRLACMGNIVGFGALSCVVASSL